MPTYLERNDPSVGPLAAGSAAAASTPATPAPTASSGSALSDLILPLLAAAGAGVWSSYSPYAARGIATGANILGAFGEDRHRREQEKYQRLQEQRIQDALAQEAEERRRQEQIRTQTDRFIDERTGFGPPFRPDIHDLTLEEARFGKVLNNAVGTEPALKFVGTQLQQRAAEQQRPPDEEIPGIAAAVPRGSEVKTTSRSGRAYERDCRERLAETSGSATRGATRPCSCLSAASALQLERLSRSTLTASRGIRDRRSLVRQIHARAGAARSRTASAVCSPRRGSWRRSAGAEGSARSRFRVPQEDRSSAVVPGLEKIASNPEFAALDPQARGLVFDRLATQDDEFRVLDAEAQRLVRERLVGGPQRAPGIVSGGSTSIGRAAPAPAPVAQPREPGYLGQGLRAVGQAIRAVPGALSELGSAALGALGRAGPIVGEAITTPAEPIPELQRLLAAGGRVGETGLGILNAPFVPLEALGKQIHTGGEALEELRTGRPIVETPGRQVARELSGAAMAGLLPGAFHTPPSPAEAYVRRPPVAREAPPTEQTAPAPRELAAPAVVRPEASPAPAEVVPVRITWDTSLGSAGAGETIVRVPIDGLLEATKESAATPGRFRQQVGNTDKLTRARQFFSEAQDSNTPVKVPEVHIDDRGSLNIGDGLHRTIVARELGYRTIPVRIQASELGELEQIGIPFQPVEPYNPPRGRPEGVPEGLAPTGGEMAGREGRPPGAGYAGIGGLPPEGVGRGAPPPEPAAARAAAPQEVATRPETLAARAEPPAPALPPRSLDTMSEAIGLSSPSGRMSERAKAAASERLRVNLFGEGGLQQAPVEQPAEALRLRQQAEELRGLAERGMKPRTYREQADALEARAAELETAPSESPARAESAPPPVGARGVTSAHTERGTEIQTQFRVVDADSLVASNDTALRPNPRYPQELQPRDRSRAASATQIDRIARELEPSFLGESPKVGEGAPVVGPDNVVESGNARTIALQRVYGAGDERLAANAEKYRSWLERNADRFGVDPAEVTRLDKPVLVRVRQTEVNRPQFAAEANEPAAAALSSTEQALSDAKRMDDQVLGLLEPVELTNPANRTFTRAFMDRVVGPTEVGRYVTPEGALSQEGVRRMQNAVLAKAYGDPSILEKFLESTENNVRNMATGMLNAAPRYAAMKRGIETGQLFDLDISPDLAAAVKKLSSLREQGTTVEDYLGQGALFGSDVSPVGRGLLKALSENARSPKRVEAFLKSYVDLVEQAGSPGQSVLFDRAAPTREDLIAAAARRTLEGGDYAAESLFADTRPAAGYAETAGRGVEEVLPEAPRAQTRDRAAPRGSETRGGGGEPGPAFRAEPVSPLTVELASSRRADARRVIGRPEETVAVSGPFQRDVNRGLEAIGRAAQKLTELDDRARIVLENASSIEQTGTLPKESRIPFREGGPKPETRELRISEQDSADVMREVALAAREWGRVHRTIGNLADPAAQATSKAVSGLLNGAVAKMRATRFAAGRTLGVFNRPIEPEVLHALREAGHLVDGLKAAGPRVPIYTSIGRALKSIGTLTGPEWRQLGRDALDALRLNLFSVTSWSLDLVGNASEVGAQMSGGVARDLYRLAHGDLDFPSLQGFIRAVRDPRRLPEKVGGELSRRTVGGEIVPGVGPATRPGVFTERSNLASKIVDTIVGGPLYVKGAVDTAAKRYAGAAVLWREAINAATEDGLHGLARRRFYDEFWRNPPATAVENAVRAGRKAGFDRELTLLEERIAGSTAYKLLGTPFGRWPFQFTRWAGELLGANPVVFRKIQAGTLTGEEMAEYLGKTATGLGGLWLINQLYDKTDFRSMEYVHDDGSRTRLSGRDPIPTALWFLATIKGDEPRSLAALKYASVPGAGLLTSGGLLTGILKTAQDSIRNANIDPRGLHRELTDLVNHAIPGQAVLSVIKAIFDPVQREGFGANLPGVSELVPARVDVTTGEDLRPRQRVPGIGVEMPAIGGTPIPGARSLRDPVFGLLSKYGLLVYRGPKQPISGVPVAEVPDEWRDKWERALGHGRQRFLGPLAAGDPKKLDADLSSIGESLDLAPEKLRRQLKTAIGRSRGSVAALVAGRPLPRELMRKLIQNLDSIAAALATTSVEIEHGFKPKPPRRPSFYERTGPRGFEADAQAQVAAPGGT